MAKIMKTVVTPAHTVPASTTEQLDHYQCDLCKQPMPEDEPYDVDRVTISRETGTNYPGDYDTDTKRVDCCPGCFETKVVPWLKSQGAELREGYPSW